jgi:hypothetical protein
MFQHQPRTANHLDERRPEDRRHVLRAAILAVTALTVLGLGVGPATAQQDRGPTAARPGHEDECFLQRVGTQYVRCDDNTGNGVPAPAWIPKR